MPLAFKASPLTCFRGKWDQIRALAFKASVMSAAPVVLQYTSGGTQM